MVTKPKINTRARHILATTKRVFIILLIDSFLNKFVIKFLIDDTTLAVIVLSSNSPKPAHIAAINETMPNNEVINIAIFIMILPPYIYLNDFSYFFSYGWHSSEF